MPMSLLLSLARQPSLASGSTNSDRVDWPAGEDEMAPKLQKVLCVSQMGRDTVAEPDTVVEAAAAA